MADVFGDEGRGVASVELRRADTGAGAGESAAGTVGPAVEAAPAWPTEWTPEAWGALVDWVCVRGKLLGVEPKGPFLDQRDYQRHCVVHICEQYAPWAQLDIATQRVLLNCVYQRWWGVNTAPWRG